MQMIQNMLIGNEVNDKKASPSILGKEKFETKDVVMPTLSVAEAKSYINFKKILKSLINNVIIYNRYINGGFLWKGNT